jgi:hypothetical protein
VHLAGILFSIRHWIRQFDVERSSTVSKGRDAGDEGALNRDLVTGSRVARTSTRRPSARPFRVADLAVGALAKREVDLEGGVRYRDERLAAGEPKIEVLRLVAEVDRRARR